MKFQCPVCKAIPNQHGNGPCRAEEGTCNGFLCTCIAAGFDEIPEVEAPDHGKEATNVCRNASCAHCGWWGIHPPPPFDPNTLDGWAKSAWDAGWRPPEGWQPSGLDVMMSLTKKKVKHPERL